MNNYGLMTDFLAMRLEEMRASRTTTIFDWTRLESRTEHCTSQCNTPAIGPRPPSCAMMTTKRRTIINGHNEVSTLKL